MRKAKRGELLDRGVWQAPWWGPNGELVLLAVTSEGKLAADPVVVADGASRIAAAEQLLGILDVMDPDRRQQLRVI